MCVLYVSFGSKVKPRILGCIAMGNARIFGRVWSEQSASCFVWI